MPFYGHHEYTHKYRKHREKDGTANTSVLYGVYTCITMFVYFAWLTFRNFFSFSLVSTLSPNHTSVQTPNTLSRHRHNMRAIQARIDLSVK